MPAYVDITARLNGFDAAKTKVADLGRTVGALPKTFPVAVPDTTGTMGGGGLSMRREFVAGQALQRTITGSLGIDNQLTRTLDGFERLKYLADASGMSLGKMLAVVGPMAAAAAALAYAWKVGTDELGKSNAQLDQMGMKQLNFIQWAGIGLNLIKAESVLQVDPHAMAVRTIRDMNSGLNEAAQLEKAIAANVGMTRQQREAALAGIRREIDEKQRLIALEKEHAALQTRPPTERNQKIDGLEKEIERIQRVKKLQEDLLEIQTTPRKVEANTLKEIDERIAELSEAGATDLAWVTPERSLQNQIELETLKKQRLEVETKSIQSSQQSWLDMFRQMATGAARLPSADVRGSQAYVAGQQQLEARSGQQRIAEQQLEKAESAALSLEAIRRLLESGQTVAMFSMDGVTE